MASVRGNEEDGGRLSVDGDSAEDLAEVARAVPRVEHEV
jgi:hypothetical protein